MNAKVGIINEKNKFFSLFNTSPRPHPPLFPLSISLLPPSLFPLFRPTFLLPHPFSGIPPASSLFPPYILPTTSLPPPYHLPTSSLPPPCHLPTTSLHPPCYHLLGMLPATDISCTIYHPGPSRPPPHPPRRFSVFSPTSVGPTSEGSRRGVGGTSDVKYP